MTGKIRVSSGTGKDIRDIDSGRTVPVDGDIRLPKTEGVMKRVYHGDYIRKDVQPDTEYGQPIALPEGISISLPDGKEWDDLTDLEKRMFLNGINQ